MGLTQHTNSAACGPAKHSRFTRSATLGSNSAELGPRWVPATAVQYGQQRSPTVAKGSEQPQVADLPAQAAVMPGLVADRDHTRYRGPAEVHVSLRNPQVELVPCRRHQIVPTLADTSKTMEGGTSR